MPINAVLVRRCPDMYLRLVELSGLGYEESRGRPWVAAHFFYFFIFAARSDQIPRHLLTLARLGPRPSS